MVGTHDETEMLGSSPMKKRRGRPSLKKHQSGGVIGESTMPIALNTLNQQSAHELSEATVKQGFCSTPVMRLSPSKDSRLGGGGGGSGKTASKTKSVLYEINNSAGMAGGGGKTPRKAYSEPFFVNSTVAVATPQKASKTSTTDPSTLSSSSPLSSNLLTSDPVHQSSSPLQTSPLPSEYGFGKSNFSGKSHLTSNPHSGNVKTASGPEEKATFSVQSSPFYNSSSKHYEDQIFKYINSSPISTAHTPRRRGFDQNMSLDSVMRLQRSTHGRVGKYSAQATPQSSPQRPHRQQQQQQQYRYRLSYRYKLTLDIDDYGKAKIYARVLENNLFSPPASRHQYDPYQRPVSSCGALEECATNPYSGLASDSDSDSDMDNFEPSRYEQYLNEQRRYNEQRQQIIRNSMKSDPYMTDYYTPIEYISAGNSPVQRARSSRPQTSHGRHLLHSQPGGFEDYINQEYERVKTVNMTYVVSSNTHAAAKGLSAGIDVDATAAAPPGSGVPGLAVYDQPAVRDEMSRLSQFRRADRTATATNLDKISESRESVGGSRNGGSNDAMAALRHAVLSCDGFAR